MGRKVAEPLKKKAGNFLDYNGQKIEVFSLAEVGRIVGRSKKTLELWESRGILPRAFFVKPCKGNLPGKPVYNRRYYSRQEAMALLYILRRYRTVGYSISEDFIAELGAAWNEIRKAFVHGKKALSDRHPIVWEFSHLDQAVAVLQRALGIDLYPEARRVADAINTAYVTMRLEAKTPTGIKKTRKAKKL